MVSAVLFAKDLRKVATFYTRVCAAKVRNEDVAAARAVARSLGGEIDDRPPPYGGNDTRFHLGHDPEGNVFGAQSA